MKFRYVFALISGFALTLLSSNLAFQHRGYWAIGGEWLIIPMCMLLAYIVPEFRGEFKKIVKEFFE